MAPHPAGPGALGGPPGWAGGETVLERRVWSVKWQVTRGNRLWLLRQDSGTCWALALLPGAQPGAAKGAATPVRGRSLQSLRRGLCPWHGGGGDRPSGSCWPTAPTPGRIPALPAWRATRRSLNDHEIGPARSASKPGRPAPETREGDLRAWPGPLLSEPLPGPGEAAVEAIILLCWRHFLGIPGSLGACWPWWHTPESWPTHLGTSFQ